jgi:hypothetical protein
MVSHELLAPYFESKFPARSITSFPRHACEEGCQAKQQQRPLSMVNDHIPKQDRLAPVCNSQSVVYIDFFVRADMETELVLEHRLSLQPFSNI